MGVACTGLRRLACNDPATFAFMLDQGRAVHSNSGRFFTRFNFFKVKSCSLLRSFSFVIAAALRLGRSIRAVRGLLTVVVAGITLPAGSALFAQQVTTPGGLRFER